jgi:pyridoxal biosynthesis lyase PdxS
MRLWRRGMSWSKMVAVVSVRAVPGCVRAAGRVRRMACRVAVKEIWPGSRPAVAAARQMTVRMAW